MAIAMHCKLTPFNAAPVVIPINHDSHSKSEVGQRYPCRGARRIFFRGALFPEKNWRPFLVVALETHALSANANAQNTLQHFRPPPSSCLREPIYPCLIYNVLLLIPHVTMWPWPLTLWLWTSVVYRRNWIIRSWIIAI